jgi:hypothetical protein
MEILRVENQEGRGPFTGHWNNSDFAREWNYLAERTAHDPFYNRGPDTVGMYPSKGDLFGCPTLETLLKWFPQEWISFLENEGFHINVYNSTGYHKVAPDGLEVMFRREFSKFKFTL